MVKSTEDIEIEAADWLARLNADNRTEADERSFQAWLAESPTHAAAFEEADAAMADVVRRVRRGEFSELGRCRPATGILGWLCGGLELEEGDE